eukprot:6457024-Amphidinium_carterae.1
MSYIEFTLSAPQLEYILNYWTQLGRECQANLVMVLRGALWYARANSRTTCPSAGILLFQAHTLVILCRPLTCHSLQQQQAEIESHMSTYLRRNAVRAEGQEWQISLASMVRGGQNSQVSDQAGACSLTSSDEFVGDCPFMAYSSSASPTSRIVGNFLFGVHNGATPCFLGSNSSSLHMVSGGMNGQGDHPHPALEEPIPYGLLANPNALAEMIETFYDDEPLASPRPRGRDMAELEVSEYDEPWVALHLRAIYETMIQYKPSLSTWKQMSRSLPSMAPPVNALEGQHVQHRVANGEALERLLNAHRAEQAVQPPASPIAPRNVWSHLTDFEQRWTRYNLGVLRQQLVAQLHNVPPNQWWRYFGRSPEDNPEAIAQGGSPGRSASPEAHSSPAHNCTTWNQPASVLGGTTTKRQKRCCSPNDGIFYMADMEVRPSEVAKEYIDQSTRPSLVTQHNAYPQTVMVARVASLCSPHQPLVHLNIIQLFFHGTETLEQAKVFFARRLRTSLASIHLSVRFFEFHDDKFSSPYCRRSYSAHHDEPPPHTPLCHFEDLFLTVDDTCMNTGRHSHVQLEGTVQDNVRDEPENLSASCVVQGGGKCWSVYDSPSGTHEKLRQKEPMQRAQGAPFQHMHIPTSPSLTGTPHPSYSLLERGEPADTSDSTSSFSIAGSPVCCSDVEATYTPNHVRAFCNAANTLRLDVTMQGAVWALEGFVRAQTLLGRCGSLLANVLDQVCHIPPEQWSGTEAPQLFFKGAIFDLVVLSMLYKIGVTL